MLTVLSKKLEGLLWAMSVSDGHRRDDDDGIIIIASARLRYGSKRV